MKNSIKIRSRQRQGIRLTGRKLIIVTGISALLVNLLIIMLNVGPRQPAMAAGPTETLSTGSFIVNMGVTTQTVSNGLKPYGLVYDLVVNFQVPVKWVIEPTKVKDGTDFTYNSVNYKGGPFVIQREFINTTIASRISYWQSLGVQGVYTTSAITVPVYMTITSFPNIMIDTLSSLQSIVINYYTNAGIPSTAYNLGSPSGLNQCHDNWTNPHGDPTWSTHNYLYNFVTVQKSFIWAECHSVSMMEGCKNPSPPYQQLNFLTTNGLQCWQSGACGSIGETHTLSAVSPYNYFYPAEPVMQFMGNLELSTQAGSERWYSPVTTGGWNASAIKGVTTGSTASPREGVLLVYGRAYGDPSNGLVMYEAGHDLTSGGGGGAQPHKVSSQRAYFNFLLLAGKERKIQISASFPSAVSQGQSYSVAASVTKGTAPFKYKWTSSMGGTFDQPDSSTAMYIAPTVAKDTTDVIKVQVTDQCGKSSFEHQIVPLKVLPLPVELLSFTGEVINDTVQLKWTTAVEINNDYFSVSRSIDGQVYYAIGTIKGNGTVSVQNDYQFIDQTAREGINYYRLSQVDYDGKIKVYDPIAVNKNLSMSDRYKAVVSPNPYKENFSVSFVSDNEQPVSISIYSLKGSLIERKEYMAKKGSSQVEFIPQLELPSGIYMLGIQAENKKQSFIKIVKQ